MVPQVTKLLRRERLATGALCGLGDELIEGIFGAGEADLGGGLFKKRLARPGGGKRAGLRVIIGYQAPRADRLLVAYAFAKNAASTLTRQGHDALSEIGTAFVEVDDKRLAALLDAEAIIEVQCDAEDRN